MKPNTDLTSPAKRFLLIWEQNADIDPEPNTNRTIQKFLLLTLWRLSIRVPKNLVLVAEDIVVDIELVCNRALKANQREELNQLQQSSNVKIEIM